MDKGSIELENERLRGSWDCFPAEHLAVYLGLEEQDQRINTHSILNRALLADTLWPGRFDALIDEELRFGVVMSWLLGELKGGASRVELLGALDAADDDGRIPRLVRETAAWLREASCPVPDYLGEALVFREADRPQWHLFEPALNTFRRIWSTQVAGLPAERFGVLEIACGSGNDYRAIRDFGLAAHLSYSGFDISWKNVCNARDLFPGVDFFEASILDSGLPDNSFDYLFVHDLLGHLSPEGLEVALAEILRIIRKEAWFHCHNVAEIDRHEVHPFFSYFRNRLSVAQLTRRLEEAGAAVSFVALSELLERKLGFVPRYTATSGTFLVRKGAR